MTCELDLLNLPEKNYRPGSYIIEFSTTPFWQTFNKFVDPFGDYLTKSRKYKVEFKDRTFTRDNFLDWSVIKERTSECKNIINHDYNQGYTSIITGGLIETFSHLNYLKKQGIISKSNFKNYSEHFIEEAPKIDFAFIILLSAHTAIGSYPNTSLFKQSVYPVHIRFVHGLNQSLIDCVKNPIFSGTRFQLIDCSQINKSINNKGFTEDYMNQIWKGFSRIFPIQPNPWAVIP